MTINSNRAAGIALRSLQQSQNALDRALSRLASGQNAPSARYDAAGVAVSSRIRAELVSLQKYQLNAQQGSAMLQVAEGAYQRVGDMLNRMRALSAQAQSSNLSAVERGMLNTEYQQIKNEINRLSGSTRFNGTDLFDVGDLSLSNTGSNTNITGAPSLSRVADFNGDGVMDMFISQAAGLRIYLGNGDGTFQTTASITFGSSNTIGDIGDFNGDGKMDVAMYNGAGGVNIYYNDDSMSFANTQTVTATANGMTTADMDGDGRTDLVVRNGANAIIYLAGSDQSFSSSWTINTGLAASTLSVVDIDNDGKMDVMARNGTNYQMLSNSGSGLTLGGAGTLTNSGSQNFYDVNGDGLMDFIWMNTTNGVNIRLNSGNGNFSSVNYTFNPGFLTTGQTHIVDMNGDGILDIATMSGRYFSYAQGIGQIDFNSMPAGGSISAYFTNPASNFIDNTLGVYGTSAVVDLNGDRKLDIIRIYTDGSFSNAVASRYINNSNMGLQGTFRISSDSATSGNVSFRAGSINLNSLDYNLGFSMLTSRGTARRAEESIMRALNNLNYFRTSAAAAINRLEKVTENIATMIENQEGARSSIADLDVAQEMSAFTAQKLVQQAGISMLGQANNAMRNIAKLLEGGAF